jgi:hypothetical protein
VYPRWHAFMITRICSDQAKFKSTAANNRVI